MKIMCFILKKKIDFLLVLTFLISLNFSAQTEAKIEADSLFFQVLEQWRSYSSPSLPGYRIQVSFYGQHAEAKQNLDFFKENLGRRYFLSGISYTLGSTLIEKRKALYPVRLRSDSFVLSKMCEQGPFDFDEAKIKFNELYENLKLKNIIKNTHLSSNFLIML